MKPPITNIVLVFVAVLIIGGVIFFIVQAKDNNTYDIPVYDATGLVGGSLSGISTSTVEVKEKVKHLPTPIPTKVVYMTSCVAATPSLRERLVKMVDETEVNAIIVDLKDYTGAISFDPETESLKPYAISHCPIADLKTMVKEWHDKDIYVIGRITVFQDALFTKNNPDTAVRSLSNPESLWRDKKGITYIDPASKKAHDHIIAIAKDAYNLGVDELNFDYIRFPSDGNMKDISYPYSLDKNKAETLKEFFVFIDKRFRTKGITISADLFGMTTTNNDDLGIGQILENALIHFDFVAPMVYPSHYPSNFLGYKTPAEKPYEVISYVMSKGIEKAKMASSSPLKLRPWLQDFSIGKTKYTSEMIKDQIRATYDVGLNSWMIWNASNVYTVSALEPDIK